MKQFEYRLVSLSELRFKEEDLNAFGTEGWELITITHGKWVCKREIVRDEVFLTILENDFGNDVVVGVRNKKDDALALMKEKDDICKEQGFPYGHRVERHDVK